MTAKRIGRPRKHDYAKIATDYRTYVERCSIWENPSQEAFVRSCPGLNVRHFRRILKAAEGTVEAAGVTKPPVEFGALRQDIQAALRDGGSYRSPVISIRFLIQTYFQEHEPMMTEREFETWIRDIYPEHFVQKMDDLGVQDLCSRITSNAVGMYASVRRSRARPK